MKTLLILTAATLVLVLAILLASWENTEPDADLGQPALPGLKEELNEVTRVSLAGEEGTITLLRGEGGWKLVERDFPIRFDRLDDLLTELAGAKLVERKTARAENHERLGLDYPGAAVELQVDEGKYAILLGDESGNRAGQYVRRPDEEQTWLMDKVMDASLDPTEYLRGFLFRISEANVAKAVFTSPDGDELVLLRDAETEEASVEDIPNGHELVYPQITDELALTMSYVRFEDVLTGEAAPEFAEDDTYRVKLETHTGLVVESWATSAAEEDGEERKLLKFAASMSSTPTEKASASPAEIAPDDAAGDAESEAAPGPELLNAKDWLVEHLPLLENRVFVVADYTYNDFTKTMDDITREIPEE